MKRLLFFIGFMTLGTFALFELLVTSPRGPETEPERAPQAANVLNLKDVNVQQRQDAGVQWQVLAATATYNEDTQSGMLEHVRFLAGEPEVQGESGSAYLNAGSNNLVLMGGVVVTREDGVTIHSERLEYDGRRDEIVSPGPVRVHSVQGVQRGDSLHYWLKEDRMEFTRPRFEQ